MQGWRWSGTFKGLLWLCLILLWMAFAVRVVSLDSQGLWRDEVDALNFATAPWEELVGKFTKAGENGPLYLLLLRGWVALAGRSAFALRYFSLLWGVVGCALVYTLGRRLLGMEAAFWAMVLTVFSPYFVWYAEEIKMYTWVPALVLVALYALERSCQRSRWAWWLVMVVATSLAFYSHILAALLIPVEIAWFLLHPHRDRRAWIGGLLSLAALTLPYWPLLRWQWPLVRDTLLQTRETGFPFYSLSQMIQMLLSGWSTGITGWGSTAGAIIFSGVAFLGLIGLSLQGAWRRALSFLAWFFIPLLIIWGISLRGPIFTDRYLIWAAPAFYLAIGAGLRVLRTYLDGAALLLVVGLLVFDGVNLYRQVTVPIKPQFQEAATYLQQHRDAETLLLFQIPYNAIVMDYYMEAPLDPYADAPFTNWRTEDGGYLWSPTEVDWAMQALVQGEDALWLVYSEASMWDDRALVKAWLDTHGVQRDVLTLQGVALFYYDLTGL